MGKKNILMLTSWYPCKSKPLVGNFIQRQAQLIAATHNVKVIFFDYNSLYKKTEPITTVSGNLEEVIVQTPVKSKFKRFIFEKSYLINLLSGSNFDLIFGAVFIPKIYQFLWAKNILNVPLILIEHNSIYKNNSIKNWSFFHKLLYYKSRNKIDGIVCVSKVLKDKMASLFTGTTIDIVGNHFDEKYFKPKPKLYSETTHFLHISTLDKNTKDPKLLFDGFLELHNQSIDFKLTVICDEDYSIWKKYTALLGNKIEFIGPLTWEEIPRHYQKSDYFVLTSPFETFSIVLLEAFAMSTPVISAAVGVNTPFQAKLGYEFQPENIDSFVLQLKRACRKEKEFNSKDFSDFSKNYTKQKVSESWNTLIAKYAK